MRDAATYRCTCQTAHVVSPSSQDISRRRLDTSVVVLGLGLGLEQKSLASARLVDTAHSEPFTTALQLLAVYTRSAGFVGSAIKVTVLES